MFLDQLNARIAIKKQVQELSKVSPLERMTNVIKADVETSNNYEEILKYGVKGMKRGVRNSRMPTNVSNPNGHEDNYHEADEHEGRIRSANSAITDLNELKTRAVHPALKGAIHSAIDKSIAGHNQVISSSNDALAAQKKAGGVTPTSVIDQTFHGRHADDLARSAYHADHHIEEAVRHARPENHGGDHAVNAESVMHTMGANSHLAAAAAHHDTIYNGGDSGVHRNAQDVSQMAHGVSKHIGTFKFKM